MSVKKTKIVSGASARGVRLDNWMWAALGELADKERRKLNQYLSNTIEDFLKSKGYGKRD